MHKLEMHVGRMLHFPHHAILEHDSFVHAVEDMDDDQRQQLEAKFAELDRRARENDENRPGVIDQDLDDELKLGDVPQEDRSRRIWAILRNVEGAGGGLSELAIADLKPAEDLMDIIRSKRIVNYTYAAAPRLVRGSRPSPNKLSDLYHHNGIKSTINLCREMHHGDDPIINAAGLTGKIRTLHIPVVDNGVPSMAQVVEFLEYLKHPDNFPVYVHCEQGVGRTGAMVACFRMAFNGWTSGDAKSEAERFKNGMPMQLVFIEREFPSVLHGDGTNPWTAALADLGYPRNETPTPPRAAGRTRRMPGSSHPGGGWSTTDE
jgi:hypothetical protein